MSTSVYAYTDYSPLESPFWALSWKSLALSVLDGFGKLLQGKHGHGRWL